METAKKQLILNKGSEKYIFRYDDGSEADLLDSLVSQASDSRTDFDWFDAAVLSFKLTQSLMGRADQIIHKEMPDALKSFQDYYE